MNSGQGFTGGRLIKLITIHLSIKKYIFRLTEKNERNGSQDLKKIVICLLPQYVSVHSNREARQNKAENIVS